MQHEIILKLNVLDLASECTWEVLEKCVLTANTASWVRGDLALKEELSVTIGLLYRVS